MIEFNVSSPKCVSLLLFGGKYKDTVVEPILLENGEPELYKNGQKKGQIKTRKVIKEKTFEGFFKPFSNMELNKNGYYPTNDTVLSVLDIQLTDELAGIAESKYSEKIKTTLLVFKSILKYRQLKTQLNTYYKGAKECIDIDGICRSQYQLCVTPTGRLTCKANNHQNIPKEGDSKVKKHFTSRYKDGQIISGDYSQLEIRIQAQLSQDQIFIKDVLEGIDFHIKRAAIKNNLTYEVTFGKFKEGDSYIIQERTKAKQFSFARAYGGGAAKISQITGMPLEDAEALAESEATMYPTLTQYQKYLYDTVASQHKYSDPWGIQYHFAPKWKEEKNRWVYNYNEALNYRNQGFATGTIVLIMLGKFWREKALHKTDKYVMINEVHDSVMTDCKPEYIEECKEDLKVLEQVKEVSKEYFNYEFNVPIKLDIVSGRTWYDCK